MRVAIRFMMFPERKSLRRSYTKLRPGPSYESIAEHYTINAQELGCCRVAEGR